ncbi:hypothetical protein [Agrobacterium cavarae]|uniref:hypothetical protein n=1 Tax=Agrobacterium cavarae TaxID=2528239 RepID=UPI002FD93957
MIRKTLSVIAVALAVGVLSNLITRWEMGDPSPATKETVLAELRGSDPYAHALLRDSSEAEQILQEFKDTKNVQAFEKHIGTVAEQIGLPALRKADDETAIRAAKRYKDLFETLAKLDRAACAAFMSDEGASKVVQKPEVKPVYYLLSDALLVAYESGKSGTLKSTLDPDTAMSILTDHLSILETDEVDIANPTQCETFIKIYDVDRVPEDVRATYSRYVIAGAPG